jgi:hypothetical protein
VTDQRAYPPAGEYQWNEEQIDYPRLPTFIYLPNSTPPGGTTFGYWKIGQFWKAFI